MMRRIIFILLFLPAFSSTAQHIPYFSFYPFHSLVLNPSLAGREGNFHLAASHRQQWASFEGAPVTDLLSAGGVFKNPANAAGITVYLDRAGSTAQLIALAHYSYRLQLGKGRLGFGLSGGGSSVTRKFSDLLRTDAYDPALTENEQYFAPAAGFGISYTSNRFTTGISSPLFINPLNRGDWLRSSTATWIAHLDVSLPVTDGFQMKPMSILRMIPGTSWQLDMGSRFIFLDRFTVGAIFRTKNGFAGLIEYSLSETMLLGYAFNQALGGTVTMPGSHELMLRIDLQKNVDTPDPRFF